MPQVKPEMETVVKIKVIGVGGSGGSAVNRMVSSEIKGVDFVAMNTDVQALHHNSAPQKLHIGKSITRGLGAGMDPEVGRKAAEESQNEIRDILKGTDMVFVTCGLGGGTGTGAGPVVAAVAKELGALTVAVVTKPFGFEGPRRGDIAEKGWEQIARNVDAIITIPNDRLLQMTDKKTTLMDSFKIVDDVLKNGVRGIAELITVPCLINLDFADVKTIMLNAGSALMGIGEASGEGRAVEAAKMAISNPLLDLSIDGANGVLFTISGGNDLTLEEVKEAAAVITASTCDDCRVIVGANIDESLGDKTRITVVATGFEDVRPKSPNSGHASILKGAFSSNFSRRRQREEEEEQKKFKENLQKESHRNTVSSSYGDEVQDNGFGRSEFPSRSLGETPVRQPSGSMFNRQSFSGRTINKDEENDKYKQIPSLNRLKSDEVEEEEDLEIPPFIRKKMGV